MTELGYDDDAEPLVASMDAEGNELAAIVAYTHDLMQVGGPNPLYTHDLMQVGGPNPLYTHDLTQVGGERKGNLFFEMNQQLRDRSHAGRTQMMVAWGVVVSYTLRALSKLPDVQVCGCAPNPLNPLDLASPCIYVHHPVGSTPEGLCSAGPDGNVMANDG